MTHGTASRLRPLPESAVILLAGGRLRKLYAREALEASFDRVSGDHFLRATQPAQNRTPEKA